MVDLIRIITGYNDRLLIGRGQPGVFMTFLVPSLLKLGQIKAGAGGDVDLFIQTSGISLAHSSLESTFFLFGFLFVLGSVGHNGRVYPVVLLLDILIEAHRLLAGGETADIIIGYLGLRQSKGQLVIRVGNADIVHVGLRVTPEPPSDHRVAPFLQNSPFWLGGDLAFFRDCSLITRSFDKLDILVTTVLSSHAVRVLVLLVENLLQLDCLHGRLRHVGVGALSGAMTEFLLFLLLLLHLLLLCSLLGLHRFGMLLSLVFITLLGFLSVLNSEVRDVRLDLVESLEQV